MTFETFADFIVGEPPYAIAALPQLPRTLPKPLTNKISPYLSLEVFVNLAPAT